MLTDMGTTTPSRPGGEHPNIAVERAVGSRSLAPTSDPEGPAREHRGGIIQDFLARCRREPQTDLLRRSPSARMAKRTRIPG